MCQNIKKYFDRFKVDIDAPEDDENFDNSSYQFGSSVNDEEE
jgi:hypothetical protein